MLGRTPSESIVREAKFVALMRACSAFVVGSKLGALFSFLETHAAARTQSRRAGSFPVLVRTRIVNANAFAVTRPFCTRTAVEP